MLVVHSKLTMLKSFLDYFAVFVLQAAFCVEVVAVNDTLLYLSQEMTMECFNCRHDLLHYLDLVATQTDVIEILFLEYEKEYVPIAIVKEVEDSSVSPRVMSD